MRSQLPAFSFLAKVTAQEGRQDKMELSLPFGQLVGTQGCIDAMRRDLGCPSKLDRARLTESDLQGHGWIFNRPQQSRTARKPLSIRQGACALSGGDSLEWPLFSGEMTFSNYYKRNAGAQTASKLRMSLRLNPTRFAHYQRPTFRAGGASGEMNQLIFKHRSLPASFDGEYSLDERDNWVQDSELRASFFHASNWSRFVRNYIVGTLEAIRAEMCRTSCLNDVFWNEEAVGKLSLLEVETYWEFSTPEPLKTVSDCERLLRAFSENQKTKRFFKTIAEGKVIHNSRSFSVKVRTGVELVIYAKTNRRVRMEVRHRLNKSPAVIGGSYVAAGVRQLRLWLSMIQDDAAKIVNQAFHFMRGRNTFPENSVSVGRLLFDMVRAIGTSEEAGTLLSMLLQNGLIVTDGHLKTHVHALRDAGIIVAQLKNRRRCYVIAKRYMRALELLSTADKSLLDARQRRRVLK
jgi:hypothetical protein